MVLSSGYTAKPEGGLVLCTGCNGSDWADLHVDRARLIFMVLSDTS